MLQTLTSKEKQIYEFIKKQVNKKGYPPSVREICAAVGLSSTSTVHAHLVNLQKKGYIKRDPDKPRAIELFENNKGTQETVSIPILGKITAGKPILAVENIEDTFTIPFNFINSNNQLFALNVSGKSMIDAGIFDGDIAILEKVQYAENGDIVAALIENEATLKRFFKENDHIRLQPENKTMQPIIVPHCEILGKLIGIYRKY